MSKVVALCLAFLAGSSAGCIPNESCFARCEGGTCVLCNEEGCWPIDAKGRPSGHPGLQCSAFCDQQGCIVCDHGDCVRIHNDDPSAGPGSTSVDASSMDDPPSGDGTDGGACSGSCGDDPDPALLCDDDGECGGGQCVFGRCHAACMADTACGTGQVCEAGFCAEDDSPASPCVHDADCGGTARTCVNGICHDACSADADCRNPADFCDRGLCRPDWRVVSECSLNIHCAAGEECVDGQCRTPCWSDAGCVTCPDGPRCVLGYCRP